MGRGAASVSAERVGVGELPGSANVWLGGFLLQRAAHLAGHVVLVEDAL